jgi:hypothetical protein
MAMAIREPRGVQRALLLFLVTFLLILPKGGLKIAGVPVTWGYLGLGAASLWLPLALFAGRSVPVQKVRLVCLALLIPFQVVSWAGFMANGTDDLGFTLSFFISFFFMPAFFLLIAGVHLDRIDLGLLLRAVRFGVLLVAAYGIFLFFYRILVGSFIEIPYLTVNAGDVGTLETKHIDRGDIFKLISTYNNGNLYGISMLLLLPLYAYLEPGVGRQAVVKASLVLTLSRTVWIGLLVYEVLSRLFVRRVTWRTVLVLSSWVALAVAGVLLALRMFERDITFIFDRRLGGRIDQLSYLYEATILPTGIFRTIEEMVYLSVIDSFGVIGLATFLIAMVGPLALHFLGFVDGHGTLFKKSLALGLVVHLIVAISDGATLYIPVMAIYWFLVTLMLSENPTHVNGRRARGRTPAAAAVAPPAAPLSPRPGLATAPVAAGVHG